jgi:hypothetical protein
MLLGCGMFAVLYRGSETGCHDFVPVDKPQRAADFCMIVSLTEVPLAVFKPSFAEIHLFLWQFPPSIPGDSLYACSCFSL